MRSTPEVYLSNRGTTAPVSSIAPRSGSIDRAPRARSAPNGRFHPAHARAPRISSSGDSSRDVVPSGEPTHPLRDIALSMRRGPGGGGGYTV